MRIRAGFVAMVMVTVLAVSQCHHLCATSLGRSAHTFYTYFRALQEESLNPVERFVFSLMLAKTKAQQEPARRGA